KATDILEAEENRIVVRVPAGAKTGKISVKTKWGTSYSSEEFIIGGAGYALAIGLNEVDPAHYAGWSGPLTGCEPDVEDMEKVATQQRLEVETLVTAQATRGAVLSKLENLAQRMKKGDLLVVSYSGHGGQIPDQNGDETDGLDETWCLYDGELLDDELHGAWAKFQAGVRILVFSDSCHSGTVLKMKKKDWDDPPQIEKFNADWKSIRVLPKLERAKIRTILEGDEKLWMRVKTSPVLRTREVIEYAAVEEEKEIFVSRSVPPGILMMTFEQNKQFYVDIGSTAPREDTTPVNASVILISGCEDFETSADLGFNGLFTFKLMQVWQNGEFSGNHRDFHEAIKAQVQEVYSEQSPKLFWVGEDEDDIEAFLQLRPYKIEY
ncbi:caspase family protein, partial [bacterium]|nr:caspase family protein [bacterium]